MCPRVVDQDVDLIASQVLGAPAGLHLQCCSLRRVRCGHRIWNPELAVVRKHVLLHCVDVVADFIDTVVALAQLVEQRPDGE